MELEAEEDSGLDIEIHLLSEWTSEKHYISLWVPCDTMQEEEY